MVNGSPTFEGIANFYLEGIEMHNGELHAVFRTVWEGKEVGSIGVRQGKGICMKDYVQITVTAINKAKEQAIFLPLNTEPVRDNAVVELLVDGASVPGYPQFITVQVGQTLTVQSMVRALEVRGVKNVKRL